MKILVKAVAAAVLAVALTACDEPISYESPSYESPPYENQQNTGRITENTEARPVSQLPVALVGRWNGGSNRTGHWYYEFAADGGYQAWPAYLDNPQVLSGTAAVRDDILTLSNGGAPVSYRWGISNGMLFLDGFSYVRV